jgi:ABC-type transport system substrate-binding protein
VSSLSILRSGLVLLAAFALFSPARGAAQTTAPSPAAAAPAPAAPDTVDPKIEAMAKDWLHRVQTNTWDRSQLTDQMNSQLTPDVATKIAAQFASIGDYTSFTYRDSVLQPDGLRVYHFVVAFKSVTLNEYLGLTPDGKVAGLHFTSVQ